MKLIQSIIKKRLLFLFLFVLFLSASLVYSAEPKQGYEYVGSVNSNKYHYFSCRWAKKIYQSNAIYFRNANDARESDYIPCKVCKPPMKD